MSASNFDQKHGKLLLVKVRIEWMHGSGSWTARLNDGSVKQLFVTVDVHDVVPNLKSSVSSCGIRAVKLTECAPAETPIKVT